MMFHTMINAPPTNIAAAMSHTLLVAAGAPVNRTMPATAIVRVRARPSRASIASLTKVTVMLPAAAARMQQPEP